jgi:hypothetical protein
MPHEQPAARFKDDTLYVFKARETQLIKAWPDLTAVRKHDRKAHWQGFEPDYLLIRPYRSRRRQPVARQAPRQLALALPEPETAEAHPSRKTLTAAQQRKRAFDKFRFACPKPVARRVEPFRTDHLRLLRLLQRLGDAGDLLETNPALGFCLAVADLIGSLIGSDPETMTRIAGWKQTDIMAQLGLPTSKRAARILAKIHPASMSRGVAVGLRMSLRNEQALKLLGHLPRLNIGVLALVNDPRLRPMVSAGLLEQVLEDPRETYFPFAARELEAACAMSDSLGVDLGRLRLRERSRITSLHDEISEDYLRHQALQHMQRHTGGRDKITFAFPPPPIPGNMAIKPLQSPAALVREGTEQSNCVGSYAARVAAGNTYIYQVLAPERATLSIVRLDQGPWQIGELLLAHNRRVGLETRRWVKAWLDAGAV